MKHVPLLKPCLFAVAMATAFGPLAAQADEPDFGLKIEQLLKAQSEKLFGVQMPLEASAPEISVPYRNVAQPASDQILLAHGLKAEYLTRNAANNTDMMVFWPNDEHPTHLFTAVEIFAPSTTRDGKPQPFVQRINLQDPNQVEVVLRGGLGGDPIRRTPWGTLIVGEETADGAVYEIIDPANVTEAIITDRSLGMVKQADGLTDETRVVKRPALGIKSWEGIGLLESGVMYSGDELRPGDAGTDRDGGAIYKFVPFMPYNGSGWITDLNQSPLAFGSLYALSVSSRETTTSSFPRYGQGSEVGVAAWVKVDPAIARPDAAAKGATGYYRPEDLEIDPMFDVAKGVRFCWTNTQRELAMSYGEVLCGVDNAPAAANERIKGSLTYLADATNAYATTTVSRFIEGTPDFNSFDNLAFQPVTGNLYVLEDHDNGDVWSCLPDGDDADEKSDGCVKVMSLKESGTEPTGLFFSKDGRTAYLSVMHSDEGEVLGDGVGNEDGRCNQEIDVCPMMHNGWPTDDILKIAGFKLHGKQGKKNAWQWW